MLRTVFARSSNFLKAAPIQKNVLGAGSIKATPSFRSIHTNLSNLEVSSVNTSSSKVVSSAPQTFSSETKDLVNKVRNQLKYFAVVQLKGRSYTVTENDVLVLNRMSELNVGDELKLNRVKELGSKDFSIVGKPFVAPEYYEIKATVVEHTQGPDFNIIKFKKRKGYRREYVYRNLYTLVKINHLEINKLE